MRRGLPISVNWTFFARCYDWGPTSDYRVKIGDFAPTGVGAVDPKFQVEGVAPPTILFLRKNSLTRLNVLSYGVKIYTDFSSVLSQFTRLTDRRTDKRTDRILIARPCLHSMRRGNETSRHSISYHSFCRFAIQTLIVKSMGNFMPNNRCNSAKVQIPANVVLLNKLWTIDKHQ